ncbi:purine permease 3-like [Aristolochia californica]|uniref:purine permease 3-like n=1 Tax=Aristolochia californica TaxID=171875 RepID=UPI0035DE9FBC
MGSAATATSNMKAVEEGSEQTPNSHFPDPPANNVRVKWWLILLSVTCMAIGSIGGPLLIRLYYVHGGKRKWVPSWLQTAGFPLVLIPVLILYIRYRFHERPSKFLAEPKLLITGVLIGVLIGLDNYMYSLGLSYIPVSTSSLLFATQLAFTAIFALIIVKQKFTHYSVNSIVLMILGSIILCVHENNDRPPGVSYAQYLLGFFVTLAGAALFGFTLPCVELAYLKASKAITYTRVLQFQLALNISATVFCSIGMLINNDFKAITREAREYELGETKYYLVLISNAIVFQMLSLGSLGVIFCVSSLFSGILSSVFLPLTEVAAVIVFGEKFTAEKGMALALCLWGFTSYFYGEYQMKKKLQTPPALVSDASDP